MKIKIIPIINLINLKINKKLMIVKKIMIM
jgi:hypothetical protein